MRPLTSAPRERSSSNDPTVMTSASTPPGGVPLGTTQSEHGKRVRRRVNNLGALAAAHPLRHHHRLGSYVVQTVAPHGLGGPCDRALQILGAAEAMTVRVGELRQTTPREIVCRWPLESAASPSPVYGSSHAGSRR